MCSADIHATDLRILTIAQVRFILTGLGNPDLFPASFQSFWRKDAPADLACRVLAMGPDHDLEQEAPVPDQPWSFVLADGRCTLTRRDQAGRALWRIFTQTAFEDATLVWHPRYFESVYGSYERSWATGLGLSLLIFRLLRHRGLVFHGNAAEIDGQGILCLGVSGSGKSTLARLLDAAGGRVLTDERPVLRRAQKSEHATGSADFHVYGSPWPSSAGMAQNTSASLARIYFLEHGAENRLTPLAPREAFNRLIHVTTIPWQDPALFDPCLATVEALLRHVPCAVLAFRPTPAVIDLIREDLQHHATVHS